MSQTAEELLDSISEDEVSMYTANPKTEEHIVIGENRYIKVPEALKRLAVQHDHNVETVTFDCPRYWDDTDLSTLYIWINYIRKDRVTGRYLAKNIRVDENDSNMIHFDWTIGNEITEVDGPLVFLVCALKTDSEGMEEVHWNSEKCSDCLVSPGMECADTTMNEYPDIITDLLARMDTIIAANSTILDTSLTQAGLAADARATGEAINKVDNRVTEIIEGTDYTEVVGNPIHLKEASRNNANLTPIGVIEQEVIEAEAGVSVVGESIHVTDVDTTKEASLFAGANTTQETREGYNLLPDFRCTTQTTNGITYTNNGDGTFNINGTATTYMNFVDQQEFELKAGTYTLQSENIDAYTPIQLRSVDGTIVYANTSKGLYNTFTLEEDATVRFRYTIQSGKTVNNLKIAPILYEGEYDSDKPYEQFGAMPSIDFPSEIKSVGGKGHNLLPLNYESQSISSNGATVTFDKETGIFKVTGMVTDATWFNIYPTFKAGTGASDDGEPIDVSGKYVITNTKNWGTAHSIHLTCGNTFSDGLSNYKQLTVETISRSYIYLPKTDKEINAEFWVMICDDYNHDEYEPYGYSRYKYDVVNKNVLNFKEFVTKTNNGLTFTSNEDGSLKINGTTTGIVAIGFNIEPYKLKGTYKLSGYTKNGLVQLYWKDKNGTVKFKDFKGNPTINFEEGDTLFQVFCWTNTTGMTFNNEIFYLQLEVGEIVSTNTAPQSQSLNLDFPEGIELNKLGDVSDKIDFTFTMDETGYKTIDRDSVKHVGNTYREKINDMTIETLGSNVNNCRFTKTLSNPTLKSDTTEGSLAYMNRYKLLPNGRTYYSEVGFTINGMLYIYDEKYNDTTDYNNSKDELLAAYNAYLNENETYVVYPMTTPITTPITDETFISQLEALINIKPYEGVTNVFVTSSDDGSCLPLTEFLYNYITAAPSVKRPTPVLGISGDSEVYHTGKNMFNKDKVFKLNNVTVSDLPNGVRVISSGTGSSPFVKYIFADISKLFDKCFCIKSNFKASASNIPYVLLGQCTKDGTVASGGGKLKDSGSYAIFKPINNPDYPYLCLNLYANSGGTVKAGDYSDYTDIQLEIFDTEADIPSDYSEPQNETINLTLPEGMELFEGESIYKEEGKWYHYKEWNKDAITGNETITYYNAPNEEYATSSKTAYININLLKAGENNTKIIGNIFCNMFKNKYNASNMWNSSNNAEFYKENISLQITARIRIEKTKIPNWSEDLTTTEKATLMKNYLKTLYEAGNPLEIVYKLANPGPEEITDATLLDQLNKLSKLKTYKGINNFFLTSAGADGLMKLEYRKFDLVGHEDIEEFEGRIDANEEDIKELKSDLETLKTDIEEDVQTTLEDLTSDVESANSNLDLKTVYGDFVITKNTQKHGGNDFVISTSTRNATLYATITKEGYYPIALLGVRGTDVDEKYDFRYGGLSNQANGTCRANWIFTNASGTSINASDVPSCEVTILWVKIRQATAPTEATAEEG